MSPANLRVQIRSTFRSLRHRNYRLYWTGQLISLIGTWMQSVAQGWLMHRLTSSAFMLGFLGFCQFLPVLLLSLWAGVIVDSIDKRKLLLLTQTAFLVQAALLATAVSTGIVKPWMRAKMPPERLATRELTHRASPGLPCVPQASI